MAQLSTLSFTYTIYMINIELLYQLSFRKIKLVYQIVYLNLLLNKLKFLQKSQDHSVKIFCLFMVKIVISPVGHERTNLPDRMGQSFCTNAVQQWSVSELCVVFFSVTYYKVESIIEAFLLTMVVTVCLTTYTFQSKMDFDRFNAGSVDIFKQNQKLKSLINVFGLIN